MKKKQRIENLRNEINRHNKLYYAGNPEVSDHAFDAMFAKLAQLETEYPEYHNPNSPTASVGSDLNNSFAKYNHPIPMPSIKSCFTKEQATAEIKKHISSSSNIPLGGQSEGQGGTNPTSFFITPKYDGIAIELQYNNNGELTKALSRGNGYYGNDITANIRTIKSVPTKINTNKSCTVRGEAFLTYKEMNRLNKLRKKQNIDPYNNIRSAVVGLVKAKQSSQTAAAKISTAFFFLSFLQMSPQGTSEAEGKGRCPQLVPIFHREGRGVKRTRNPEPGTRNPEPGTRNPEPETRNPKPETRNSKPETRNPKPETRNSKPETLSKVEGQFKTLKQLGFKTPDVITTQSLTEAIEIADKIAKTEYPFPADGAVIKQSQINIEPNTRYQIGAWAVKTNSPVWETTLRFVEWSVSAKGKLTPIAHFQPFTEFGSTFAKANLINIENINRINLTENATIQVQITGFTTPQIIAVSQTPGAKQPVTYPTHCPQCHQPLTNNRCTNANWCPAFGHNAQHVAQYVNHKVQIEIPKSPIDGPAIYHEACRNEKALIVRRTKHRHDYILLADSLKTVTNIGIKTGKLTPGTHTFEHQSHETLMAEAQAALTQSENLIIL